LFSFESNCSFERLLLDNVRQTCADGVSAPLWLDKGVSIKTLIERDSVTKDIKK